MAKSCRRVMGSVSTLSQKKKIIGFLGSSTAQLETRLCCDVALVYCLTGLNISSVSSQIKLDF